MTQPHRIVVGRAEAPLALAQWGEPASGKPPALLLHGTGFVAEVWTEVAAALASDYTVYALDRRGHGLSHKPPADRYHFQDFAEDVCTVVESLDFRCIFGIGHSAGATDLLLAAKLMPGRFAHLFVMEPTVMDPRTRRTGGLSELAMASVQGVLRRQAEFDSPDVLFQRLRKAPAFAPWTEPALWAYVRHGFAELDDGRIRLRCTPEIESALLKPIFQAMEQTYSGDTRGNPFPWLSEISCPVRIATAEQSWPIYKEMAARAAALIPHATRWTFEGIGHCVAQEAPDRLLNALRTFTAEVDGHPRNDPAPSSL
ncbi:alpha/beta hydrolase [Bradyrhizobium sp. ISRA443]|uniref:alpha/beta fold hydrolase n=1 Tax=unclassified Bradyrhizobium TaxID=2631580 RepID=UPI00247B29D3|nr:MULTISPECIES: alpha/beta hydrolase [unclassified Bradyrhizobium]WGR91306.1 alpha/beta hydrolase [Bradyrhizobium sp. ISRA435]WGS01533.1 alpha/beta hydrolase [Bradyrhizobium sp. ISRA436]WGS08420.1 alpha/beta hydrolase [Bradyrhizobium sp. ISRA437]WGS15308.1 alpha/beta hydrolase [Bradyrhizobium sp. ISRA443]